MVVWPLGVFSILSLSDAWDVASISHCMVFCILNAGSTGKVDVPPVTRYIAVGSWLLLLSRRILGLSQLRVPPPERELSLRWIRHVP